MKPKAFLTRVVLSLLVIQSSPCSSRAETRDPDYAWPIQKIRTLSSVFADHRHFHFHSGIDIPTHGKTGYNVLACQSGYVYRIRTSWSGYGKAIYLKLDDGRFAVYGHLSQFSDELSEMVRKEQLENRRYDTDVLLQPNKIRVKMGELVGYSGESGWGGPHLHFELRDSINHPINPLTFGFSVRDESPPIMEQVTLKPQEVGAQVDGSAQPVVLSLSYDHKSGIYRPNHTPVIEGEVGLEISVHDKMDQSGFKFGIYRLELYLDDSLLFASQYDRISFETTHQIEVDRDYGLRIKRGKEFYRLYVEEGNGLTLYCPAGGRIEGRSTDPDSHRVTIKAFDAAGNLSLANFPLIFNRAPMILSYSIDSRDTELGIGVIFEDPDDVVEEIIVEGRPLGSETWQELKKETLNKRQGEQVIKLGEGRSDLAFIRMRARDSFGIFSEERYLVVNADQLIRLLHPDSIDLNYLYSFENNTFVFDLKFSSVLKQMPEFSLKSGGFNFDPLFCEQTEVTQYRVTFPYFLKDQKEMILLARATTFQGDTLTIRETLPVAIMTRSTGGTAASPNGQAKAETEPNVLYSDMNVSVITKEPQTKPAQRLLSKIYSFGPSNVPLNGRAKISISYPREGCNHLRLGLYELTGKGSWNHVGQDLDTLRGTVAGMVRYLSSYALLEDTLPPRVERISIRQGVKIKNRNPNITAMITDDLSGIGDEHHIEIEVDGEWMIPEYDVDKRIVSTRPIRPLLPGKHLMSIWARDRAGNEITVTREFSVIGN